jgi:hypothetical protein
MSRTFVAAIVAVCVMAVAPVSAHPVPFSYLDLRLQPEAVDASLVIHIFDIGHDLKIEPADRLLDPAFARAQMRALVTMVSERLALTAQGRRLNAEWGDLEVLPERQSIRLRGRYALAGPVSSLKVKASLFPYDEQHQTFINVYEGDALTQAVLSRGRTEFEYFAGTRQGVVAVIQKFIPAGVHHILIGPDHILFLVGLLLLGGSLKRLALIVTGFTLAHSLTLSLAALNLLTPPARLIEPAIALSIVYVGADNLLMREGRDYRAWIAFGFGFIHGFGFANVLREMDLPARALGWSLFSFNLGVEVGQLLIVGIVATLLSSLRARSQMFSQRLVVGGSIVVIAFGAFWFVQRILVVS